MPSWFVASITVAPWATSISFPSTVSFGTGFPSRGFGHVAHDMGLVAGARPAPLGFNRAVETCLFLDVVHELVAEMLDEALHRQRRGIAQRADGAARDVVGDVVEEREVFHAALAVLDAVHHAVEPAGALAAGRAL